MLDDLDRRLLRYWQADPTLSAGELADRCGVTAGKAARRIARMEDAGIVEGIGARINWAALGYAVEVSLRVTLDKTMPRAFDEFAAEARQIPEVLEIQTFLGQVDVRLGLIARDLEHYQALYRDRILTLPHITDLEALMHVARIKTDETVPL